jgi:hypothetical protein
MYHRYLQAPTMSNVARRPATSGGSKSTTWNSLGAGAVLALAQGAAKEFHAFFVLTPCQYRLLASPSRSSRHIWLPTEATTFVSPYVKPGPEEGLPGSTKVSFPG